MSIGGINITRLFAEQGQVRPVQQATVAVAETGVNPARAAKIDGEFAALFTDPTPEEMLQEIAGGGVAGLWKWKIKQMQKDAAEKIMGEMSLTQEQVAALPDDKRVELETKIIAEVQRRVQMMVVEQMKRDFPNGLPPELRQKDQPPMVDITV